MSTDLEFTQISDTEGDFITGGALLDLNLKTENYRQTKITDKCSCNQFEGLLAPSSLCICDNCKWARVIGDNSENAYCLKLKNK